MDTYEEKIFEILKRQENDITIIDIAKYTKIDRHTAAKYLERMQSKGLVEYRAIGKSKVWKLTNSPIIQAIKNNDPIARELKDILSSVDRTVIIRDTEEIVMDNNKYINKDASHCYEKYVGNKTKCKKCAVDKTFSTGKSATTMSGTTKITTQPIKNNYNDTIAVVEIIEKKKK